MNVEFNLDRIKKYDEAGPRYTSYPTAISFTEQFTDQDYFDWARKSAIKARPLSLYFHIPFCDSICFFCACNKIATKDRTKTDIYLDYLNKEIQMQSALFDTSRRVEQLHWGGGTPTFLNHEQIKQLMDYTRHSFNLLDDDSGDYSIEIDPRSVSVETIKVLRETGFNRFSLGVQDIDEKVQKAVNRIQPVQETINIIEACRENNAKSISIDLIYGLPLQSPSGFASTLKHVIEISPDRISLFNYAHLPHIFKPQRRINESDLPVAQAKLTILKESIQTLTTAGYVYIGMDHFAKPEDELSIAQNEGRLHRNFQGYTTHAGCDLIAMGVSAISSVSDSYSQNAKTLDDYYALLDENKLPIVRGIGLNSDDILRRYLIQQISCHFNCNFEKIETLFKINFKQYFHKELQTLQQLAKDDLLELSAKGLKVMPVGRLLVRTVCMVFDAKLQQKNENQRFSKVI